MPEPIEKIATRNMFYDEQEKHVRTKKEILDENGNVRTGCKITKKGKIYERDILTAKNRLFKQEHFTDGREVWGIPAVCHDTGNACQ